MYANLKSALQKKGITMESYAEFLNVSKKTVTNKINQDTDFTFGEYSRTCKFLLPEYNPDYLFATDNPS